MRAGAQPSIIPARPETARAETTTTNTAIGDPSPGEDRAAKVARLALVRPGITTATTMAHERTLPVASGLQELLPRGALQRGSTVAAHGVGATSFSLALVAEAVRQGSFLAVIAPRSFGIAACVDFEIPLRRVVQFVLPEHERGDGAGWAQLVAAVVEGFDAVIVADRRRVTGSQARQLGARVRERGAVLVRAGGPSWPEAADLRYDLASPMWEGLGTGHGHLESRTLRVQIAGRRWHGNERVRHLALPASLASNEPATVVVPEPLAPVVGLRQRHGALAHGALEQVELQPGHADDDFRHAGSDIDHLVAAEDQNQAPGQASGRATA